MLKYLPLEQVCTHIVDCPHESPEWRQEGIPVIRNFNLVDGQLDMTDGYFVDEETYKKRTKRTVPQGGDIVFSREAPIGNCCILPQNYQCCLGQRLVLLRVNKDICSSEYLLTALLSKFVKSQIDQIAKTGSIVSNFAIGDLKHLLIPIIDEQQDVADISSKLNAKISLNNSICSDLEAMAKQLYDYWFVQFDFPDENGKPYKSSGGKMVWNEELKREIPEGWNATFLRGQYNIERGISYTSKDIENPNGIPMLNLACVDTNRNYRVGELKYYSGKINETSYINGNELLIACTDLTRNADIVGSPILVPNDGTKYCFSMDMAKIYSTNSNIKDMYLYMCLRTDSYHNYIKRWASGTNVLHLNLDGINWYGIAIPPIKLQEQFSSFMVDISNKRGVIIQENQQLTSLRDFLLPMLMNGQVKIK